MQIILLSGGSGKRLWPLSNDTRSKQFLKLLQTFESSLRKVMMLLLRKLQDWALKLLLMQRIDKAVGVIETLAYHRVRVN